MTINRPSPETMVFALGRLREAGRSSAQIQEFLTGMGYNTQGDLMMLKQVGQEMKENPSKAHEVFGSLDDRLEGYLGSPGFSSETRDILKDTLGGE